jgi:hypothetical protein
MEAAMEIIRQDADLVPLRMDFTIEAVRTDEGSHTAYCVMVPDVRRYTRIERNGEKFYFDKYLSKIEKSGDPNEFRIGRRLYELIHVKWLERATEVSFEGANVGIPGYKVYRVT